MGTTRGLIHMLKGFITAYERGSSGLEFSVMFMGKKKARRCKVLARRGYIELCPTVQQPTSHLAYKITMEGLAFYDLELLGIYKDYKTEEQDYKSNCSSNSNKLHYEF